MKTKDVSWCANVPVSVRAVLALALALALAQFAQQCFMPAIHRAVNLSEHQKRIKN